MPLWGPLTRFLAPRPLPERPLHHPTVAGCAESASGTESALRSQSPGRWGARVHPRPGGLQSGAVDLGASRSLRHPRHFPTAIHRAIGHSGAGPRSMDVGQRRRAQPRGPVAGVRHSGSQDGGGRMHAARPAPPGGAPALGSGLRCSGELRQEPKPLLRQTNITSGTVSGGRAIRPPTRSAT